MREVFRQFLIGNHNYRKLASLLGVSPRGVQSIMRNPIWTGWRVVDKKRDTSPAGRYRSQNGRQADRRKVARSPDEIIRVRVIEPGLISEADFSAVQGIMDRKRSRHWRCRGLERRVVYNGFLTCSACGEVIHTALVRHDY